MVIYEKNVEDIKDKAEVIAGKYLLSTGFKDVVYEPDGNIPPDFLLNGRIAVEVRRLNQNMSVNGKIQGIEEISIPLKDSFVKLLDSLRPPTSGESWYVAYRFYGTDEEWVSLRIKKQDSIFKEIKACLSNFMNSNERSPRKIIISEEFELIIICKADKVESKYFLLGSPDSPKRFIWGYSEIERNIKICLEKKNGQLKRLRKMYPACWLLLINHIPIGLDEFNRAHSKEQVQIEHNWDKVILIDPNNRIIAFEI